jgi:SAM-dependent methyltransferase
MSGDRLLRAHRLTNRWRDRLWIAISAVFDGMWLGLLDPARLARLDELSHTHPERKAISYVDADYNRSGLYGWEATAIDEHFAPGSRVVVTGAGGGREVIALLERGFDAIGYEPNAALVAAGTQLLDENADRLRACDRDVFPADVSSCDAVVVGWGSYTLIAGRARRLAFLRGARRALPRGAPLLCSFWLRPPERRRYFAITAATASIVRRLRRAERPDVGDTVHRSYAHWFTREEVEAELVAGGFRMVAFSAEPYGHAIAIADEMIRSDATV